MNELDAYFQVDSSNAKSKPECIFQGMTYRITVLSERLIRLEYSKRGIFCDELTEQVVDRNFPVPLFTVEQNDRLLQITTQYFVLKYTKEKTFDGGLEVTLLNTDKVWDIKNKEIRNFKTSGQGFINGKLDYQKGLYSLDGFVTLDDSRSLSFASDGFLQQKDNDEIDLYLFMYRRDFGYCLKDYFKLTGYPPLIPRFAFGVWWNKRGAYTFADIQNIVTKFEKYQMPLSVFVLDDNWHLKDANNPDKYLTGYTFNRNLIPDVDYFTNYMHARNIKIALQINPSEGIMPHEEAYEIIAKNLGRNDRSTIPFNVFDKRVLLNYFRFLIDPLRVRGIDFFWLNYTHPINRESQRALIHYHYLNANKAKEQRSLIMTRNIALATHRYPILASGANLVSWDTLSSLPFYTSLGSNKGNSWWSHDIGGTEQGIEEADLYTRYVQYGCFSTIFRFSSSGGKYYKREPWLWDAKTISIVREYTQMRHRLIPYLYSESYKYHKIGLPIIQPLYYSDPIIYDEPLYKNEYLFGSELLISPITKKKDVLMNRTVQNIFLPSGMWYDFKTGKKFPGDHRYVAFYKDEDYPVFAKSGSIITLQDLGEDINDTLALNSLEIHIFPGKSNIYQLYEDDGVSSHYKDGYYIITTIDYNYLQNNYTVIIRPVEGKIGIIPEKRNYRIRFRNTRRADDVIVYQDQEIIDKTTYIDDNDFIVEIRDVNTASQLTVNCKGKDIEIDAVRIINEEIDSILNDVLIETTMKEEIAKIMFSKMDNSQKRIEIRKLHRRGLEQKFIKMLIRIIEYASEI